MIRSYRDLILRNSYKERFDYLVLRAGVGHPTFGHERYLNQKFYASREWKEARDHVIVRDMGCDLGVEGYEIHDRIYIHHMNPIRPDDLIHKNDDILDPEFLICVTHTTHNAIHYGGESALIQPFVDRTPGDTKLW